MKHLLNEFKESKKPKISHEEILKEVKKVYNETAREVVEYAKNTFLKELELEEQVSGMATVMIPYDSTSLQDIMKMSIMKMSGWKKSDQYINEKLRMKALIESQLEKDAPGAKLEYPTNFWISSDDFWQANIYFASIYQKQDFLKKYQYVNAD